MKLNIPDIQGFPIEKIPAREYNYSLSVRDRHLPAGMNP